MMRLTLKTRVMLGVYTVYIIRRLKSPFVGELFVLTLLFGILSFLVSLPHVLSNIMLTRGSYTFFVDAFSKTHMTVKLILVSALASGLLFLRNVTVFTTSRLKQRFI